MSPKFLFAFIAVLGLRLAAEACAGDYSFRFCALTPSVFGVAMLDPQVNGLINSAGAIRHIDIDGRKFSIAVSDSEKVVMRFSGTKIAGVRRQSYSWPLKGDYLLRLQDYPTLVKALLHPNFVAMLVSATDIGSPATIYRVGTRNDAAATPEIFLAAFNSDKNDDVTPLKRKIVGVVSADGNVDDLKFEEVTRPID